MTLRDLTPEQEREFQKHAERRIAEINKSRSADRQITTSMKADYALGFSDGVKAVLARITSLPE